MNAVAILFLSALGLTSATNAAGVAFLASNKAKDGVVELASGLRTCQRLEPLTCRISHNEANGRDEP